MVTRHSASPGREKYFSNRGETVPSVARDSFIAAMGCAATGVHVVATDGPAGRFGLTVSAVSSVSADPPLVLACINRRSPALRAILENRAFCVNVLSADQSHISDVFAGRPSIHAPPFDFACAKWTTDRTGSPCLEGAAASFDCFLYDAHEAGSHALIIGRVVDAGAGADTPLIYAGRAYARLQRQAG